MPFSEHIWRRTKDEARANDCPSCSQNAHDERSGMEPDDLLCSRNARSRTPLVGRAQWKIIQPPSLGDNEQTWREDVYRPMRAVKDSSVTLAEREWEKWPACWRRSRCSPISTYQPHNTPRQQNSLRPCWKIFLSRRRRIYSS
jgi:hypothetical protein